MNKKLVIFDWGGVVESHNKNYSVFDAGRDLIKSFTDKFTDEEISAGYKYCSKNEAFKTLSELKDYNETYKWIDRLQKYFNISVSYEEFINKYLELHDKIFYYKDVVSFAKSLKDKCKIALLSNLPAISKSRIDKHYKLEDFDYVWLSFELEMVKPNEEIYRKVIELSGYDPNNMILIDDTKENIDAANKVGIRTCMATGEDLEYIKIKVEEFLNE